MPHLPVAVRSIDWSRRLGPSTGVAADGAGPLARRSPADRPMLAGPANAGAEDHGDGEQCEKRVMARPDPEDQEDNGSAGEDAHRETLHQGTALLPLYRARVGRAGGQALIDTRGDLLVN